jgi:hypothetical protein
MQRYCEQIELSRELQIFEFSIATAATQMLHSLQHSVNDIEIVRTQTCRHSTFLSFNDRRQVCHFYAKTLWR